MKQRKSNLELLRIVCMCGIIFLHYMGSAGLIETAVFPDFSWFYRQTVYSFCVPAVNCFVLISGYFLVERNVFSLRKPVEYFILTVFYGSVGYIIGLLRGSAQPGIVEFLKEAIPFVVGNRWFVETYIMLLLISPFVGKMLRSLKREHYQILLIIQLSLFSVWYSIGLSAPVLDNGYGIINFLSLYMIGGYIRLHGSAHSWFAWRKRTYAAAYLGSALFTFVLSYFMNPFGYAFFTNIISAVAVFLLFLNWEIGTKAWINRISAATFDEFFVHSDRFIAGAVRGMIGLHLVHGTPWMIPHMLLDLIVMWILGYFACILRRKLFGVTIDKLLARIKFVNYSAEI